MVTNARDTMSVNGGFLSVETFYGLSTDTKPTVAANGSKFVEMDTGKEYLFDYEGATWYEFPAPAPEPTPDPDPDDSNDDDT